MNDGQYYSSQKENDIVKYQVTTGEIVAKIVDGATLNPKIEFDSYTISPDEQKILLTTETEAIYRRSFRANYFIYDVPTKQLTELSKRGKQSYATLSPDGKKVAFCRENNLFVTDLASKTEMQITTNGNFSQVINGSTDWVYEEEFGFAQAFYWSPDGKKIAFYSFDESRVKEYNMQMWNEKDLYPYDYRFKYPKAGENNSLLTISVYDLPSAKTIKMDIGTETDIYIPKINWTYDSNLLSIRRMNRLQNTLEILHANSNTGASTVIYKEVSDSYVDIQYAEDMKYLKDGKSFIFSSEKDGFKHLYLSSMDGKEIRQLTKGNYEVSLLGIDENLKKPIIYYTSTEVSPMEKHFYSIDFEGKNKSKLSTEKGTNDVNMSADFKYYVLYHSNSEKPLSVSLFQTKDNKKIKVLEENQALNTAAKDFNLAKKEIFSFKTSDNQELHGFMLKPKNFDPNKKYPVLMYVYGGPSSQEVSDSWGGRHFYYHQYLTENGYIVACVDNRGTDAKGANFKKSTYANLGKYETQDQIEAAKYLGNMAFVDKSRIGIWGWSYGGYMSSLCILLGNEVFKTAVAVAPVTNWRFYDNIYTERFLKRPQDNPQGYDDFSPVTHASKLKGNFLLIHGTGDDNVHFQNAVILQNALIKEGKQFQSFYYPNRNHGIRGGNTSMHLYQMMADFVLKNL
ncbi:MAG: S9 family peptidase [Bacteroidetes bacterium]|nr:MAG: S9 family peptidase [Bacteroidota bacterium]